VIEFAELEGFEHVALRTYSTGMLMRLSVALALCGSHSIVLIDDVLSVGDIAFQQKVADRVHALRAAGTTLLLAFGDDLLVQQLATRVITLGNGRVVSDAPPRHWAGARTTSSAADVAWQILENLPEDEMMTLRSIGVTPGRVAGDSFIHVSAVFDAKVGGVTCRPSLILIRDRTKIFRTLYPAFVEPAGPQRLAFSIRLPTSLLPNGKYSLTVSMLTRHNDIVYSLRAEEAVTLTIRRDEAAVETPEPDAEPRTLLLPVFPWEVEAVAAVVA
jgi:hypothetical protein